MLQLLAAQLSVYFIYKAHWHQLEAMCVYSDSNIFIVIGGNDG